MFVVCVSEYGHRHAIAQVCSQRAPLWSQFSSFLMWILGPNWSHHACTTSILGAAEVGGLQVQDQTESKHVLGARVGVSLASTKCEFAECDRPQFKNHYSKFRFLKTVRNASQWWHIFNPSTWKAEASGSPWVQGQPGFFYKASSRTARIVMQRNPVLKRQNKNCNMSSLQLSPLKHKSVWACLLTQWLTEELY